MGGIKQFIDHFNSTDEATAKANLTTMLKDLGVERDKFTQRRAEAMRLLSSDAATIGDRVRKAKDQAMKGMGATKAKLMASVSSYLEGINTTHLNKIATAERGVLDGRAQVTALGEALSKLSSGFTDRVGQFNTTMFNELDEFQRDVVSGQEGLDKLSAEVVSKAGELDTLGAQITAASVKASSDILADTTAKVDELKAKFGPGFDSSNKVINKGIVISASTLEKVVDDFRKALAVYRGYEQSALNFGSLFQGLDLMGNVTEDEIKALDASIGELRNYLKLELLLMSITFSRTNPYGCVLRFFSTCFSQSVSGAVRQRNQGQWRAWPICGLSVNR